MARNENTTNRKYRRLTREKRAQIEVLFALRRCYNKTNSVSMTRKGYAMAFDYPVILSKRGERFLASFPDFPGCYGEGSDRLDAMEDARTEGVNCILQELEEGNPLPPRSLLDELCLREGEEAVMLTLTLPREENWSWLG